MLTLEEFTEILDRVAQFIRCSECQRYPGSDRWCESGRRRTRDKETTCRAYVEQPQPGEVLPIEEPRQPPTPPRARAWRVLVSMGDGTTRVAHMLNARDEADAWRAARGIFGADRVKEVR